MALTGLSMLKGRLSAGTAAALPSSWFTGPYAVRASVLGSDTHTYLSVNRLPSVLCPGGRGTAFQSEITSFPQDTAVHRVVCEQKENVHSVLCFWLFWLHGPHLMGREEMRLRSVQYVLTGPLRMQAHL